MNGFSFMLKKLIKLAKSEFKRFTLKELKTLLKIKKLTRNAGSTLVMRTFTVLGSAGFLWTLPTLYFMKDRKYRFTGFLVFTGIATDVLLNTLLSKILFHRKRPWRRMPEEFVPLSLATGYSFPSGHALVNATVATILILDNKRSLIIVLPVTGLIIFSRIYLFAHYPSDVIAGATEGIIIGDLIYNEGNKLLKEGKLEPVERVLDDDYFFDYKNLLHPIEYFKRLLTTFFGKNLYNPD